MKTWFDQLLETEGYQAERDIIDRLDAAYRALGARSDATATTSDSGVYDAVWRRCWTALGFVTSAELRLALLRDTAPKLLARAYAWSHGLKMCNYDRCCFLFLTVDDILQHNHEWHGV